MTDLIVDLFAGPGGWDVAMRQLGLPTVGLEWDAAPADPSRMGDPDA